MGALVGFFIGRFLGNLLVSIIKLTVSIIILVGSLSWTILKILYNLLRRLFVIIDNHFKYRKVTSESNI